MAQQLVMPVLDDGEILISSPLVILDTKYYELYLQIVGNPNSLQYIEQSPLPLMTVGSPATMQPCIAISPLPDSTAYSYRIRRFNSDNQASDWVTGTFTTGS